MKQFNIIIHYEGSIDYEIEAKTEDEAIQIAEKMFNKENNNRIAAASIVNEIIADEICEYSEIE